MNQQRLSNVLYKNDEDLIDCELKFSIYLVRKDFNVPLANLKTASLGDILVVDNESGKIYTNNFNIKTKSSKPTFYLSTLSVEFLEFNPRIFIPLVNNMSNTSGDF